MADLTPQQIKHVELLQVVINRMASNSFLYKGWAITITSALIALAIGENTFHYLWLGDLVVVAFWMLDSYYLWQERLFRKLYQNLIESPDSVPILSMDTSPYLSQCPFWSNAPFRPTIYVLYCPMVVLLSGLAYFA